MFEGNMVRASRSLLSAVTRLLIMADMIDVHLLMKKLKRVENDLEFLKSVSSQAELLDGMDRFGTSCADLMAQVNCSICQQIFFCISIKYFPARLLSGSTS